MNLFNTLIIDPQDPQHPVLFSDLIEQNSFIVFIVIGSDSVATTLVERADILADDHRGKIERRVIWISDHSTLAAESIAYVSTFPDYDPADYDQTLAYVLSPKHHECKYIFMDGDPTNDFNISKAYWKASLREREIA